MYYSFSIVRRLLKCDALPVNQDEQKDETQSNCYIMLPKFVWQGKQMAKDLASLQETSPEKKKRKKALLPHLNNYCLAEQST